MDSLALIVCLGILFLLAMRGYYVGVIKVLLYVAVLVLSVGLSSMLIGPVSTFVKENTSLYGNVETSIEDVIDQVLEEQEFVDMDAIEDIYEMPEIEGLTENPLQKESVSQETLEEFADSESLDELLEMIGGRDAIENFVEELPFPEYMLEAALDQVDNLDVEGSLKMTISEVIADNVFNAIVYVGLWIVFYVVLSIVIGALNVISMLPVIKEMNRMAGLLLGLAEGVLVIWVLCILLQACGSESWAQDIFVQINDSEFLSFIYNNNLIANVLNQYM